MLFKLLKDSTSLLGLLCTSLVANSVLSASTVKSIQGQPPALTFDHGKTIVINSDELLSITFEDTFGNKTQYTPADTSTINVSNTVIPEQFKAHLPTGEFHDLSALTPISSYFFDVDGDVPGTIEGYFVANWIYQEPSSFGMATRLLPAEQLSTPFEPCKAPFTLTTQTYGVTVNSAYGIPASYDYGSNNMAYKVAVQDYRLCYLQPINADANVSQTNPTLGGFNSTVFERYKGFSFTGLSSVGKSFPTIAFDKASFIMKMSNAQDDYTFTSNHPVVDINEQGVVTFNSAVRPTLPIDVTLTATPKNKVFPAITYQFSVKEWARVIGSSAFANNSNISQVTDFIALSSCSGQLVDSTNHPVYIDRNKYMFVASELTNSTGHLDFYYRDVDGTLQGEWGKLNKYNDSRWDSGAVIWTSNLSVDGYYYNSVDSNSGKVSATKLTYTNVVLACRT